MNQDELERETVEYLFGEMPDARRAEFERRLADDADLRRRCRQLAGARTALDSLPEPAARVDLARLYRHVARRADRSRRRWRWGAAVAAGVALLVGLSFAASLRVEWREGSAVVSWGGASSPAPARVARAAAPGGADPWPTLHSHDDRLEALGELVQAALNEMDRREREQGRRLAAIDARLARTRRISGDRITEISRDVTALYHLASYSKGPDKHHN